ncbi:MAG: type II toxin-antitoxin system RelE/ParE family toxin [Nostoc sp.]
MKNEHEREQLIKAINVLLNQAYDSTLDEIYALLQKIEDEEDENNYLKNYKIAYNPNIYELAIEPRPNGVKKLQGEENTYRIRVSDYRVIYDIFDEILLVNVIDIGHRSKVYKNES